MGLFGKGEGGLDRLAQTLNATDALVLDEHAQQLATDTLAAVVAVHGDSQTVDIRTRGSAPARHNGVRVVASARPLRVGDTVRFQRGSAGIRSCSLVLGLEDSITLGGWVGKVIGTPNGSSGKTVYVQIPSSSATVSVVPVFKLDSVGDTLRGDWVLVSRLPRALTATTAAQSQSLLLGTVPVDDAIYFALQKMESSWDYDAPRLIERLEVASSTIGIPNPLVSNRISERSAWSPVVVDITQDNPINTDTTRDVLIAIALSFSGEPAVPTATYGFNLDTIAGATTTVTWYPDTEWESEDSVTDATSGRRYWRNVSEIYARFPNEGEIYHLANIVISHDATLINGNTQAITQTIRVFFVRGTESALNRLR